MSVDVFDRLRDLEKELEKEIASGIVLQSKTKMFLSYSSRNRDFAERIGLALQMWGFPIWIDRLEIGCDVPDSSVAERLSKGVRESDCLLLLLSKDSVRSGWVQMEYEEALRREQQGTGFKLLLAVMEDCEIPEVLSGRRLVDFRENFDSAVLDIVAQYGIRMEKRGREPYNPPRHTNLGRTHLPAAAMAYNVGLQLYQRGDLAGALSKLNAATREDPEFVDAIYCGALVLYQTALQADDAARDANLREAAARYALVLEKRPDDVDAMVNLAVIHRECASLASPDRERELLARAYRLAPDYGLVWLNFGFHFAARAGVNRIRELIEGCAKEVTIDAGHVALARRCYERARELDPKLGERMGISGLIEMMDILLRIAGQRKGASEGLLTVGDAGSADRDVRP